MTEDSMQPNVKNFFVAETWRRILAYFVDQMFVGIFFAPIFLQILRSWIHGESVDIPWLWLILCALMALAYQVLFLRLLGATIGKLIFALRVVNFRSQESLTWMQCLLRAITDHLSFFFSQSFRVLALARFDRRHVSDWVAETQVMQLKAPAAPARPRVLLTAIFFVYFFISGFYSAYSLIHRSEWSAHSLTLHPVTNLLNGPDSGSD